MEKKTKAHHLTLREDSRRQPAEQDAERQRGQLEMLRLGLADTALGQEGGGRARASSSVQGHRGVRVLQEAVLTPRHLQYKIWGFLPNNISKFCSKYTSSQKILLC